MMRTIAKRFVEGGFMLSELARELNVQQETQIGRASCRERV